ncbi:MAG: clostripain-related cysteine peptidase [Actinomycetota bacterium]|nr:clostripain-related cysteine peptidase [Actinomycetota bacterium]
MTSSTPFRSALALLTIAALAAGCSNDNGVTVASDQSAPSSDSTAPDPSLTPWTVLVYSIADTNLEPFMMVDLDEAGAVGSGENVNIVALVDRSADYSTDPVLGQADWVGAKALFVQPGGTSEVLAELGDIDTGDPAVLSAFIQDGLTAYPAQHYALIISDHGASWPGVGGDESANGNGLTLAEISTAISDGLQSASVDKLDLLGFDACLMATYEVATTLAPLADRMVASEELEPGHGWDYRSLGVLAESPDATADDLGNAILDGFQAQARVEGTDAEITLSLLDLTKVGELDAALGDLSSAVSERAAAVAPAIGSARASTLGFGRSPDPTEDSHMADLGQLVSQIGVDALDLSDQADATLRALGDVVVRQLNGAATLGSTGLSIYFPPVEELLSPDYAAATGDSPWFSLLTDYYAAGDAIPVEDEPDFTNDGDVAEAEFDDYGVTVWGYIDPEIAANVSEAYISYGLVDEDGSIVFFGDEPADVSDDGSGLVTGSYDLTMLTITDGVDTAMAYLWLSVDESTGVLQVDVPMAYYAPDAESDDDYQDVLLSLTLDGDTGDILSETYYVYDEELDMYGELTADPNGIIVPEVLRLAADGTEEWVPTSDVGLYADLPSLQYDLVPLDPGTELYLSLTVVDFGGNYDAVGTIVFVPE